LPAGPALLRSFDQAELPWIRRQPVPHKLRFNRWLFVGGQPTFEYGKGLTQSSGRRSDDPVQPELVSDLSYALARTVLIYVAEEVRLVQTNDFYVLRRAKVQDLRDANLADEQTPRPNELGSHPLGWLDEMTIGLDYY
jgi:hypothetical protein